jgi:hypothetical protein
MDSMDNFTTNERRIYKRPLFDPAGVLVARRELKLRGMTVSPATILPADHGLSPRDVMMLWDQCVLDTYPPGTVPDGVEVLACQLDELLREKFTPGGSFGVPGTDGKPARFSASPGDRVNIPKGRRGR